MVFLNECLRVFVFLWVNGLDFLLCSARSRGAIRRSIAAAERERAAFNGLQGPLREVTYGPDETRDDYAPREHLPRSCLRPR